jgi:hypothetical protein
MARLTLTQIKALFNTGDTPFEADFHSTFEALDARYDAAVEYFIDDMVFDAGEIWKSIADNNTGNTPSSSPLKWERWSPDVEVAKVGFPAKINEGTGLTIGDPIYVSGATGNRSQISLADNTDTNKEHFAGLCAETGLDTDNVDAILGGELKGVDTSSWSDGDTLWLGAGVLQNTRPTSGAVIRVGVVSRSNPSQGSILIFRTNDHYLAAPANEDIDIRLGDSAGATALKVEDYGDNEVASIDSDGNIAGTRLAALSGNDTKVEALTGQDVIVKLGSNDGTQDLSVQDSDNNALVNIDSNGKITAQDGATDLTLKMYDASGTNKVSFQDSSDVEVAKVDSDGGAEFAQVDGGSFHPKGSTDLELTSSAGNDVVITMGDSAGSNKTSFADQADVEVASIDSDGNVVATSFSGDGSSLTGVSGGGGEGALDQMVRNESFLVWQHLASNVAETTGRATVNDQYTADRWKEVKVDGGGTSSTITIRKSNWATGDPKGAFAKGSLNVTAAGTGSATTQSGIKQIFKAREGIDAYKSTGNAYVSFWAKTSNATNLDTLGVYFYDGTTFTSSKKTLTTSWQEFSLAVTGLTGGTIWTLGFDVQGRDTIYGASQNFSPTGAADLNICNIQVNEGTGKKAFNPVDFDKEIWRCFPYAYQFEMNTNRRGLSLIGRIVSSTTVGNLLFNFCREMVQAPTITFAIGSNAWGVSPPDGTVDYCDTTSPVASYISKYHAELNFTTDTTISGSVGDQVWVRIFNTVGYMLLHADY